MDNSSYIASFILVPFKDMGNSKHVYFIAALIAYLLMLTFNLSLILLILFEKSLHEPMYIFLCNLLICALVGCTNFYIKLLIDLQTDVPVVSRLVCFTQIFFLYIYFSVEITILTVMAYDRFIAINVPLLYSTIISYAKALKLIILAWIYPICCVSILISLSSSLKLCGNTINTVYCNNWEIVKLSCTDTSANNVYGSVAFGMFLLPILFILYSYIKILVLCWNSSRSHKWKAFQTCLPHLVTFTFFLCSIVFEIIESRLRLKRTSDVVSTIASLESVIISPLLNPLIYGIILPEIRRRIIHVFFPGKKQTLQHR
uniref:Olfactory receptor n=2 Tax=Erpetoichthys calabaricus TaxID=27687 RepID=A0A8C4RVK3_ERPCA